MDTNKPRLVALAGQQAAETAIGVYVVEGNLIRLYRRLEEMYEDRVFDATEQAELVTDFGPMMRGQVLALADCREEIADVANVLECKEVSERIAERYARDGFDAEIDIRIRTQAQDGKSKFQISITRIMRRLSIRQTKTAASRKLAAVQQELPLRAA